jgi:hypothetical protein
MSPRTGAVRNVEPPRVRSRGRGAFRWTPGLFCSREAHIVRISSASAAVFLILGSGSS